MTQTFEDWIDALNLKPASARGMWDPARCAGTTTNRDSDRFRVTRGDSVPVLIACRTCVDHLEGEARAKRIGEITRAVFG